MLSTGGHVLEATVPDAPNMLPYCVDTWQPVEPTLWANGPWTVQQFFFFFEKLEDHISKKVHFKCVFVSLFVESAVQVLKRGDIHRRWGDAKTTPRRDKNSSINMFSERGVYVFFPEN